ncbi:MAG TPA: DUF4230 domain-containing protein [Polyangiaceae bacterium]|nr:DUF4230 domain-containing protein [Polyangiaceae bacterium]
MNERLPPPAAPPRRPAWLPIAGAALLLSGLLVGVVASKLASSGPLVSVSLPPASSSSVVVRPSPSVLKAMRDLARLESASFHMERVIDVTEKQSRFFGLLESDDALLLVASAEVSAGVDLSALGPGDVAIDPAARRARVTLPPAQIFHTELDNQRTFVHSRRTGLLAKRDEGLEGRARAEAERTLGEAAREAGIVRRAESSAAKTVEALVRSLGYDDVEVRVRPAE